MRELCAASKKDAFWQSGALRGKAAIDGVWEMNMTHIVRCMKGEVVVMGDRSI